MKKIPTAIRSDFFQGAKELDLQTKDKEVALGNGSSNEEVALYDLSRSGAWKVLEEMISDMMGELDTSLSTQIESGAPFDEIGKTAIVKELVKGYLLRILQKVHDATEAVEGSIARKGGGSPDQG